ncbi:MAG: heavy-metal-associated domain-containing protein [Actinomycetia bacterium]|nr:heavy-metal-associated domain-containing protein [Actinomycetes bacterium]MCP3911233.1 heavy-metal-associated domain-containing protein [Actinomycetes bacterium]MCP4085326.1 heavy-metal-associated domain-containing protein [Actinomycetes bacterium]
MSATRTYSVPDISCDHCVSAITGAVTPLDGVDKVLVDLQAKQVTVDGGDDTAIREAIDDAGYDIVA